MTTKLPPLPEPLYIFADTEAKLRSLNNLVEAYGQACRDHALLDAMNATRSFGKTGEVIAMVIRGLK